MECAGRPHPKPGKHVFLCEVIRVTIALLFPLQIGAAGGNPHHARGKGYLLLQQSVLSANKASGFQATSILFPLRENKPASILDVELVNVAAD